MKLARLLLAVFFVAAGANHFVRPQPYLAIMPSAVPWPEAMVYLSGLAELLGGVGVLFAKTRRAAGLGLIALLIAVFPANIHAAIHGMNLAGWQMSAWILWIRLPLQPVLIAWVYIACWKVRKLPRSSSYE